MATYNRVNVVSYGEKPASSQKYNQEIDNIYSGLNDIDSKVGKVNVGQEITGTGATTINWQNGEKVKFTFGSGNPITGESLGTGDGTTTAFSGTLLNPPVVGGSIKIYYTIGGTNYNAVDDGAGNLSGTSCSGTINYETGGWSLTFSTAPDNTTSITANYENGKETLTFTAPAHSCNLTLVIIQDGTGYRTLEYPTDVIWVDGQEPQISKNANSVSVIKFYYDNTKYYGAISLPTLEQVRAKNNQLAGDIDANNHTIINLTKPVNDTEPVRKADFNLWATKSNMPTQRYTLTSSIYNTDIYVIGGSNSSGRLSTNEQYNVSTDTWATKTNMPTARSGLTSSIYNTDIYAINGSNTSGFLHTNEQYNVSTDTWATKANIPTARDSLTSSIYNTGIYCIGGYNGNSFSTNEQYDVSTDTWTTKANMPTARRILTSSIYNTDIYVIGGYNGSSSVSTNEQYDVSTDTWATKANMPTARWGLTSSIYNTDIYAIGGYNGYLSTNEQYDVSTDTWATKANMPTARWNLTSSIYNTDIYVIGGYNGAYLSTNEVMIIGGGI